MFKSQKLAAYVQLVRLDKPIGILLLLWPTLWALLIAGEGQPSVVVVIVFILGVILMRSAGCAINDFADRDFDGNVERTRHRPIVTGKITPKEAIFVFAFLCLLAFCLAVYFLNQLTVYFSFFAVALAASYPFTKRYHYLPQVHLGMAFAWAVPMAFVAITNDYPPKWGWLLLLATILWTTAFDTMYGMVDRKDDIRIGVKSTAILFGTADRLIIGILQVFMLLALFAVGSQSDLRYWYYISLVLVCVLFLYQHVLIYSRLPEKCFKAFLNNNYVGLIIFIGIAASYWSPF